ncbi:hypothetical protein AeMF1_013806 [Aphanomyces euteiches]|nr:hypothetical protein AeMF1_013806 [Aphanomyces euteiches]KAH9186932.1 hypothetical protein AeNC1_011095 [Aphanomyces euteiches]
MRVLAAILTVSAALGASLESYMSPAARAQLEHRPSAMRRDIHDVDTTVLNVDLNVTAFRTSVMMQDGTSVNFTTRAYNEQIPGPTIYVTPGDTFTITLRNQLQPGRTNATNLHLHGLHLADELTPIQPQATSVLSYTIPQDHPSGTYWYHPHLHGLLNSQMSGLMAGAIVILDRIQDMPPTLQSIPDHIAILQGVCTSGCPNQHDVLESAIQADDRGFQPQVESSLPHGMASLLVNGESAPTIRVVEQEWFRVRWINAVANNGVELVLPCTAHLIARDGVTKATWPRVSLIVIPPGGRADVVMQCERGLHTVQADNSTERNEWLGVLHRVPSQLVMQIQAETTQAPEAMKIKPLQAGPLQVTLPWYMTKTNHHEGEGRCSVEYAFTTDKAGNGDVVFGVNHVMMTETDPGTALAKNVSTTWCLGSDAGHSHPFHVHTTHFRVLSSKKWHESRPELYSPDEWRDTIPLYKDHVRLRFIPAVSGSMLSHCHIAWHADRGMGRMFHVED